MAFIGGIGIASGVVLVIALAVLAVGVTVFSRRSAVVDPALARTHFSRDGKPTSLAAVARSLDHVMCATELQSGEHFYFAPSFLYSYRFGRGQPAGLQLSTAVQASACLPGAFAARRLPTAPYSFQRSPSITEPAAIPGQMLLTDGGVYDNMADQWLDGLAARVSANAGLRVRTSSVDEMVVVNSSAGPPWIPVSASWLPVRNELNTVLRVKDVQYAVSTSRRRHQLVTGWEAAASSGRGVLGALVHIAQSPFEVPDAFATVFEAWTRRGITFISSFGMTEVCGGFAMITPAAEAARRLGTAGRPCLYSEAKIGREDGGDAPGVLECAAYGVPDEKWGEAVAASVVLAPGSGHDQDSIRNDLRARIAAYKIPKHIEFAATLPRTTSGKILRRALRERMAQQVRAGALSLHADRPSRLRRP